MNVTTGRVVTGQRICIYGTGGIGKTSLASHVKKIGKNPLFLDAGEGTNELDIARIRIPDWDTLTAALSPGTHWDQHDVAVVDTLTESEDFARKWVPENITTDRNTKAKNIEAYGYGKGFSHLYDTMLSLFSMLEWHTKHGRDVIVICHVQAAEFQNPDGENYKRYVPHLYDGKSSVRDKMRGWLDHLFFVNADTNVENGKAQGHGTRTIYYDDRPSYWAKTRRMKNFDGPIVYNDGSAELWERLFKEQG